MVRPRAEPGDSIFLLFSRGVARAVGSAAPRVSVRHDWHSDATPLACVDGDEGAEFLSIIVPPVLLSHVRSSRLVDILLPFSLCLRPKQHHAPFEARQRHVTFRFGNSLATSFP